MNEEQFLELIDQTANFAQQQQYLRDAYKGAESAEDKAKLYQEMRTLINNDPRRGLIASIRGEKQPISIERMVALDKVLIPLWKEDMQKSTLSKIGGTTLNVINDAMFSVPEKAANLVLSTGHALTGQGFNYAEQERETRAALNANNPYPWLTFGLSIVASVPTGKATVTAATKGATLLAAKVASSGVKLPAIALAIAAAGAKTNRWFDTYTATDGFIAKIGTALAYTAKQSAKQASFGALMNTFAGPVAQGWETMKNNAIMGALFGGAMGTAGGMAKGAFMGIKNSDATKTLNMLPKPGESLPAHKQMLLMQRLIPKGEEGAILSEYIAKYPQSDMRHIINSLASGQAIAAKNGYTSVTPELVYAAQKAVGNIDSLGGYGSNLVGDRINKNAAMLDAEAQTYKSQIDGKYAKRSTPTTRIASAVKDTVGYLQDFYRKAIKEPLSEHLSTTHRETRVDAVTALLDTLENGTDTNSAVSDIPAFSSLKATISDILGPSKKWKAERTTTIYDDRPSIYTSSSDSAPTKIGEVGNMPQSAKEMVSDSPRSIVDDIPTSLSIKAWAKEAKTRLQGERQYSVTKPEDILAGGVGGYRDNSLTEIGRAVENKGDPNVSTSIMQIEKGKSVEPNVTDTPISLADMDRLLNAAKESIGQVAPRSFKNVKSTLNTIVDNNFTPDGIKAWKKNTSIYATKLGDSINNAIEMQSAVGASVDNTMPVGAAGYQDTGTSKLVKPGTGADKAESMIAGKLPQTKEILDSLRKSLDYVDSELRSDSKLADIPLESGGTLGSGLGVQRANNNASRELADSISIGVGRGDLKDSFGYYSSSPDIDALENKKISEGATRLRNLIFGDTNPLPMSTTENALNPQRRQLSQDVADSFGAANLAALPIPLVDKGQALTRLFSREVSATGNPKLAEASARLPEYISGALDSPLQQTRLNLAEILGGGKPLPEPTRQIVSGMTAPTLAPMAAMAISRATTPEPSVVVGNRGIAHTPEGNTILLERASDGAPWSIVDTFTKQQLAEVQQ